MNMKNVHVNVHVNMQMDEHVKVQVSEHGNINVNVHLNVHEDVHVNVQAKVHIKIHFNEHEICTCSCTGECTCKYTCELLKMGYGREFERSRDPKWIQDGTKIIQRWVQGGPSRIHDDGPHGDPRIIQVEYSACTDSCACTG